MIKEEEKKEIWIYCVCTLPFYVSYTLGSSMVASFHFQHIVTLLQIILCAYGTFVRSADPANNEKSTE